MSVLQFKNILIFPVERTLNFMTNQDKLIKQHVLKETKDSFSRKVEDLVWEKDISHLDAVTLLMEKQGLEPETVGKLISKDLQAKLETEAEKLSLIKTKKNRLM